MNHKLNIIFFNGLPMRRLPHCNFIFKRKCDETFHRISQGFNIPRLYEIPVKPLFDHFPTSRDICGYYQIGRAHV